MALSHDEKVAIATTGAITAVVVVWLLWRNARAGAGTQVVPTAPGPVEVPELPFQSGQIPVNEYNLSFQAPSLTNPTTLGTYIPLFGFIGSGPYGLR